MERYFRVTNNRLYKDWFDYKVNQQQINDLFKSFKEEQGFESGAYYVTDDEIYIVPVETDLDKFGKMLCKPIEDDLQKFKTNSKVGKAWVETLKLNNLNVLRKPMLIMYMSVGGGRFRSRLFNVDEQLYCSLDPADDAKLPQGFTEMKASEFFKIIEDMKE
jgi:hypothetical protein